MTIPGLAALLLLGCGGPNRQDTGPASGAGAETGAVPGDTGQMDTTALPADTTAAPSSQDTSGPATTGDTSAGTDSAKANQTSRE